MREKNRGWREHNYGQPKLARIFWDCWSVFFFIFQSQKRKREKINGFLKTSQLEEKCSLSWGHMLKIKNKKRSLKNLHIIRRRFVNVISSSCQIWVRISRRGRGLDKNVRSWRWDVRPVLALFLVGFNCVRWSRPDGRWTRRVDPLEKLKTYDPVRSITFRKLSPSFRVPHWNISHLHFLDGDIDNASVRTYLASSPIGSG